MNTTIHLSKQLKEREKKKTDKQKPLNVPFLFWMYFEYIASRREQCKFCHFSFEQMQTQKIVWWMAPNVTWRKCRALVQNSQDGEIEFGNYVMFETQENAQNVINFAAENFLFTHFIYGWKDKKKQNASFITAWVFIFWCGLFFFWAMVDVKRKMKCTKHWKFGKQINDTDYLSKKSS